MSLFDSIVNGSVGGHTHVENGQIKSVHKQGEYGGPKGLRILFRPKTLPCLSGTLSYCVYFPSDFEIIKGGKLPGLCGGCHCNHTGFATRLMWRRKMDGEVYVHGPLQSKDYYKKNWIYNPKYGDSLGRGAYKFKLGDWNSVKLECRLNDVGSYNGYIKLTVNDIVVFEYTGYSFRDCENCKIDTILFVMFYGGSDQSWAPNKDTYALFKEINFETH